MAGLIYQRASWRNAIGVALTAFVVHLLIFRIGPYVRLAEWGQNTWMFDMMFGWDAASAGQNLTRFGAVGRSLYVRHLALDSLDSLLMALMSTLLIAASFRSSPPGMLARRLVWLPLAWCVLAWIENLGIGYLILGYPAESVWVAVMARGAGLARLALTPATAVSCLTALVWAGAQEAARRQGA